MGILNAILGILGLRKSAREGYPMEMKVGNEVAIRHFVENGGHPVVQVGKSKRPRLFARKVRRVRYVQRQARRVAGMR